MRERTSFAPESLGIAALLLCALGSAAQAQPTLPDPGGLGEPAHAHTHERADTREVLALYASLDALLGRVERGLTAPADEISRDLNRGRRVTAPDSSWA